MCHLLRMTFSLILINFIANSSLANSSKLLLNYNKYKIHYTDIPQDYENKIEVYHDGTKKFEVQDHSVWLESNNEIQYITGAAEPNIVVTSWSGGAHCCYTYNILELNNDLKTLATLPTRGSQIEFISNGPNAPYDLVLYDTIFDYFYASFADSVSPKIYLKWNSNKFAFNHNKMSKNYSSLEFKKLLTQAEKDIAKTQNLISVLKPSVDLLYSGNIELTQKFIHKIFNKYNFDNLSEKEFMNNLLCRLSHSTFADSILEVNKQQLKFPSNCPDLKMMIDPVSLTSIKNN